MKKTLSLILLLAIAIVPPYALGEKRIQLDQLMRPDALTVDPEEKYLYIVEFPVIKVFSLDSFKLVKEFGARGEGPGEFLRFARIYFHKGALLVHSQGKLSYYSSKWERQKEHKLPVRFDRGFKPYGDKIVAAYILRNEENKKAVIGDQVVMLHDWNQKKIKEVFRKKYYFDIGGEINGIYLAEVDRRAGTRFMVWKDKLFVEADDGENGLLNVYDPTGKLLYTVKHEFEKIKVTDQHKELIRELFQIKKRRLFEIVKMRGWLWWPSYFPAVHIVRVTDDRIYMIPYKTKQGKIQLFVFDLKGKLLRCVAVPLTKENIFTFHPICIKGGKIYQLSENDDEVWELRISDIATLPDISG